MWGRALTISLLLAAVLGPGIAQGELAQQGNVRLAFDGGFTPRALPRSRPAPVTVTVSGAVSTTDGSPPPVLRRVEIALNRNGRITSRGLPSCRAAQLQSRTTATALDRCRAALVGRGSFEAQIDGSPPVPASGKILAFNGRAGGGRALLLQLSSAAPVRIAFVVPLKIRAQRRGDFGTVLAARLPTLAAGAATVTAIKLRIGRNFTHRGRRLSYLSSACSAPRGFNTAVFPFAKGRFHFSNGASIATVLSRSCRVRGGTAPGQR